MKNNIFASLGKSLFGLLFLIAAWVALGDVHAQTAPFRADSKRPDSKMDIVITEIERQPRTSLLEIKINNVGSSVGSSFFLLCSVRELARQRGNFRYIAKVEGKLGRGQMLVGFLNNPAEMPETLDARLAGQQVIDLERFAIICDGKR